jgi:hypothetical protein
MKEKKVLKFLITILICLSMLIIFACNPVTDGDSSTNTTPSITSSSSIAATASSSSSATVSSSSSSVIISSSSSSETVISSSSSSSSSELVSSSSSSSSSAITSSSSSSELVSSSSSSESSSSSDSNSSTLAYTFTGSVLQLSATTAISGSNDLSGGLLNSSNGVAITATGGKLASTGESLYFVNTTVSGDFTIIAKLKSITTPYLTVSSSVQYRAGLMAYNISGTTANIFAQACVGSATTSGTYEPYKAARLTATGTLTVGKSIITSGATVVPGDSLYLKLVISKTNNTYISSYSTDGGLTWTSSSTTSFTDTLPESLSVGLFAAPGGSGVITTFENVTITTP